MRRCEGETGHGSFGSRGTRARWSILARAFVGALLAGGGLAPPAPAALLKYDVRLTGIADSNNLSPNPQRLPYSGGVPVVTDALIDESSDPPVLRLLTVGSDNNSTFEVPDLSGFIFTSRKWTEGPMPDQAGVNGSSASQIYWGTVTGWSSSGRNWCNSEPASICLLAGGPDESTVPNQAPSPFYDIGTWFFHGTGFTSPGYVWTRFTANDFPGANAQQVLRGALAQDGTVPGLPLAGLALLGAGVAAAAVGALRRGRR